MKKLILHPTDTSQWHAMVHEAQAATRLILTEATESYLVFLLMRFAQKTQLLESVVALDFLESMQRGGSRQVELLRDVGDKSLLFCGLFPGMAERRHVSLEYYVDMGQAAYLSINEIQQKSADDLFFQLGEQFSTLKQILEAMRGEYLHVAEAEEGIVSAVDLPIQ